MSFSARAQLVEWVPRPTCVDKRVIYFSKFFPFANVLLRNASKRIARIKKHKKTHLNVSYRLKTKKHQCPFTDGGPNDRLVFTWIRNGNGVR